MILDTSPLVGERTGFRPLRLRDHSCAELPQSAGNFLELSIVIEGQFGAEVLRRCDALFRPVGIAIEPFTVDQAHVARQAFHDFGKGRHPAALNFGDCFAYALAKVTGDPLFFKGEDFRKTDIVSAL